MSKEINWRFLCDPDHPANKNHVNCEHNICAEYGGDKLYYGCLFNDLWCNEEPRE